LKYQFEVGTVEKHLIDFSLNRMNGKISIKIDNHPILNKGNPFWVPRSDSYEFKVGDREIHNIVIKWNRPVFFPFFLKWESSIIVDNKLLKEIKSY
jgi:hypothetical protein